MSEIMKGRPRGTRWHLLTTASSVALITSVYRTLLAEAAESDSEPSVWVELGVHSDLVRNSIDSFALPFGNEIPPGGLTGPLTQGLELSRSDGEDGKVAFRPDGTNWVPVKVNGNSLTGDAITTETHTIVDFSAGKDVGLGMLGRGSRSVVGAGVRFANFTSKLNVPQVRADVDVHFTQVNQTFPTLAFFPSGVRVVPWYFTSASQVWHNVNASGTRADFFFGAIGTSVDVRKTSNTAFHGPFATISIGLL